jgi:hypothetical protein
MVSACGLDWFAEDVPNETTNGGGLIVHRLQ